MTDMTSYCTENSHTENCYRVNPDGVWCGYEYRMQQEKLEEVRKEEGNKILEEEIKIQDAINATRKEIMDRAKDHYWDSLGKDKELILLHLVGIIYPTGNSPIVNAIEGIIKEAKHKER